jgi:hypothetical protein
MYIYLQLATLRRQRSVKRTHDPDNVFRLNQNVEP